MAKYNSCIIILIFCIYVNTGINGNDVCTSSKEVGPVGIPVKRYYYNSGSQLCKKFEWGGVQSNGNNFATKGECMKTCGCLAPKKIGFCRAAFRRYYYNNKTGSCQGFTYGGCGANANNFATSDKCQKTCGQG